MAGTFIEYHQNSEKRQTVHDHDESIWQTHSMKFLESAFRTDRQEKITCADGHGKKTGDCGDTIEFFLMIKDDRIETISYAIDGCINTNACANAIIDLLEGKRTAQAWELDPENVANYLESLPEDHFHCAQLATGALYLALADARNKQKSPWKKLYQNKR
ncbi:MAG: iron-sulfur cluster assembly scaffold protein [Desulfobacteraceae bacterium]|jgi:nitrogen fixation NifU-like protein